MLQQMTILHVPKASWNNQQYEVVVETDNKFNRYSAMDQSLNMLRFKIPNTSAISIDISSMYSIFLDISIKNITILYEID